MYFFPFSGDLLVFLITILWWGRRVLPESSFYWTNCPFAMWQINTMNLWHDNRQGRNEMLGEEPLLLPLCPIQIYHEFPQLRTRPLALRSLNYDLVVVRCYYTFASLPMSLLVRHTVDNYPFTPGWPIYELRSELFNSLRLFFWKKNITIYLLAYLFHRAESFLRS